jgi:hypothetical protein
LGFKGKEKKEFEEVSKRSIKLAPYETKSGTEEVDLFEFAENIHSVQLKFSYSYNFHPEKSSFSHLGSPCDSLANRLKTGDICLFSTYRLLSAGTRLITRSKWDHVAVVVVMNNVPMLLEVTNPCGVEVAPATTRLHQYRLVFCFL